MGKEIATQVQEAQRVPYRKNPRRNTPRHIVIKVAKIKDKEKLLKAAREKRQINKLPLHLKQLEKEEQKTPIVSRRKEIIKIRS